MTPFHALTLHSENKSMRFLHEGLRPDGPLRAVSSMERGLPSPLPSEISEREL